jgi:hypothetical protein
LSIARRYSEIAVRTIAGLSLLGLSLAVLVGCSRGRGEPAPVQPVPAAPTEAKPEPPAPKPEPEPEPEPAPGELVQLKLPKDGGAWPWAIGAAPQPADSRPISFKGSGPYAANGFAVRPEVNRAIVTMPVDPTINLKKGVDPRKLPAATRVTLYDTAAGAALTEWAVPGLHAVLDLSPDGRSILATQPSPGRDRGSLRLWVIGSDGQLKRWSTTAHTLPREGLRTDATVSGSTEIRWAEFLGERVVSMSRGGQLRVFNTEGLKPLATIDASPCRPTVSPDGTKVAFLIGPSVALLDPQTRKITGVHWIGQAPPHPVLRFSPDGSKLAVGGNGRVLILNMASGEFQNVVLPQLDVNDNGQFDKPFGWAGANHLIGDSLLFDPQLPAPVWSYSPAELVQFRGRRMWACVRSPGSPSVTLQAFDLPGPGVEAAIAAVKSKAGAFGLHPGAQVKIDVAGIPEERRPDVEQAIGKRLRALGFAPDAKATTTVIASVDSPGTRPTVSYGSLGSHTYTKKPARLRVVLNGKELWNDAWAVEPPYSIELPKGTKLDDYLDRLSIGQPDYRAFSLAPLPTHLPGPNALSGPLGHTNLTAIPASP